jgi:hypothetical protein
LLAGDPEGPDCPYRSIMGCKAFGYGVVVQGFVGGDYEQ